MDDEPAVLKALNRVFLEEAYEIFLSETPFEALEILEQEKIHLIITDLRIPQLDGYSLLKEVKKKHQETIRLILSGYADEKLIFSALQNNLAKMYLLKPWDNQELLGIIKRVFQIHDLLMGKIRSMSINMFEDLPTLKSFYQYLSSLIETDAPIDKITAAIEADQSIASRILRIANSAFYSVKTASIKQAIIYLGYSNIKNIVLGTTLLDNDRLCPKRRKLLWHHSNICNRILHLLYQEVLHKKIHDIGATAGLLHDIGKVFLFIHFNEEYQQLEQEIRRGKISPSKINTEEENCLGISHQEMGGYLLDWWELPLPMVEAALFHHQVDDAKIIHQELVSIVHLANYYSHRIMQEEATSMEEAYHFLKTNKGACDAIIEKNRNKILSSIGG